MLKLIYSLQIIILFGGILPKPVSIQKISPPRSRPPLKLFTGNGKENLTEPSHSVPDIDHAEAIFDDNLRARELNARLKNGEKLSSEELAELRNYISSQMPRLLDLMAWNMAKALCSGD